MLEDVPFVKYVIETVPEDLELVLFFIVRSCRVYLIKKLYILINVISNNVLTSIILIN